MAAHAQQLRADKLGEFGLEYPIWMFDADEASWPRKLTPIMASSQRARLSGWYAWHWEYGTAIRRFDDALPPYVEDTSKQHMKPQRSIDAVLNHVRYDGSAEAGTFRIVYEAGKSYASKLFEDWNFNSSSAQFVNNRRIVRIEREWDDVIVWDRGTGLDLLNDPDNRAFNVYGVAVVANNDEELLQISGASKFDIGESVRKAEFELFEGDNSRVKGIIYPARTHSEHGLVLSRGPDFVQNRQTLADTALANAPWSEVRSYVEKAIWGHERDTKH